MFATASFSLTSSSSQSFTRFLHRQLHRRSSSSTPARCLTPCRQQPAATNSARRTTNLRFRCLAMGRELESLGVPTSVPVKVAHELLQAGHRYLDVRTPDEFSAGHASGAINIPYMYRTGTGMAKNPKFLEEVAGQFGKDDEIIVGCQSGKRSMMAAADLLSAGFVGVTDMAGGYAAWAQTGLPTEA
ncbi:hypothetical protein QQ045_015860 [Rhodiola kirilowii]